MSNTQPYTLTLSDVKFDRQTGTIVKYIANYTDIIIPDSFDGVTVKVIGDTAFRGDASVYVGNKLTRVIFPDSLEYIGYAAFSDNELVELTIPASVTGIGEFAFFNNESVKVIAYNRETDVEYAAFGCESGDEEFGAGFPDDTEYR